MVLCAILLGIGFFVLFISSSFVGVSLFLPEGTKAGDFSGKLGMRLFGFGIALIGISLIIGTLSLLKML